MAGSASPRNPAPRPNSRRKRRTRERIRIVMAQLHTTSVWPLLPPTAGR